MPKETLDEVLAHYGVLGMKWGVRRDRRQLAKAAKKRDSKKPQKLSKDAAAANAARKKAKSSGVKSLSNQELQALNNRLNLEQQYSKLSAKQTSPGQKFVNDMIANLAKRQAMEFTNYQISKLLKK